MSIEAVDPGGAREYFVSGLARVEVMGPVSRFVLYVEKTIIEEGASMTISECPVTIIMPNEAIGPGIEITLRALGTRIIVPALAFAAKHLIM